MIYVLYTGECSCIEILVHKIINLPSVWLEHVWCIASNYDNSLKTTNKHESEIQAPLSVPLESFLLLAPLFSDINLSCIPCLYVQPHAAARKPRAWSPCPGSLAHRDCDLSEDNLNG